MKKLLFLTAILLATANFYADGQELMPQKGANEKWGYCLNYDFKMIKMMNMIGNDGYMPNCVINPVRDYSLVEKALHSHPPACRRHETLTKINQITLKSQFRRKEEKM
ncbi:MAG: hypothetical protein FWG84_00875 [Bacteroidales bacterium]|nr:hypothetical protein [Bacteroidales bacterium]